MRTKLNPMIPAALAAALALGMAACERKDDRQTVGQALDSAMNSAERKADEAGTKMAQAMDAGTVKLKDAGITTGINAMLAGDTRLSASKIDVDTTNGNVTLRGTAPDSAARQHATEVAEKVDGVRSVNNQLQIRP
ncbi:BON domain-containing protein [Rivibacter subsaxonicus]|uniref:BON domain-containing protein n=1 Tax=Rivibacter subsaxonicus TaxID=457575 RepID=A0A4Q7VWE3_9BURK|nr:BON domain-containing protein [Rivibacter subsaxonicus]RZU00923.1 BON domain-containing protein [Rivibacter subsaxonicus]